MNRRTFSKVQKNSNLLPKINEYSEFTHEIIILRGIRDCQRQVIFS